MNESTLYGVMAEFKEAEELIEAARKARLEGYHAIEAYSPFPIDGLAHLLGFKKNRVPLLTLIGGIVGGVGGYVLQYYAAVIDYPINVGGRPLHSWPAFIPAMFELAVLGSALAALLGMLFLNGLPHLYHPMFNTLDFGRASRDRFFLCIRANDPLFDADRIRRFLEGLAPQAVEEVSS